MSHTAYRIRSLLLVFRGNPLWQPSVLHIQWYGFSFQKTIAWDSILYCVEFKYKYVLQTLLWSFVFLFSPCNSIQFQMTLNPTESDPNELEIIYIIIPSCHPQMRRKGNTNATYQLKCWQFMESIARIQESRYEVIHILYDDADYSRFCWKVIRASNRFLRGLGHLIEASNSILNYWQNMPFLFKLHFYYSFIISDLKSVQDLLQWIILPAKWRFKSSTF